MEHGFSEIVGIAVHGIRTPASQYFKHIISAGNLLVIFLHDFFHFQFYSAHILAARQLIMIENTKPQEKNALTHGVALWALWEQENKVEVIKIVFCF